MPWFRIDDGFCDHPKVLRLRRSKNWQSAIALWTLAGAWSSKQLTNGRVSIDIVLAFGFKESDAEALVQCGLWTADGDEFVFHDWAERNPTREQVQAKQSATRNRVSKWRGNAGVTPLQESSNTSVTPLQGSSKTLQNESVTPPPRAGDGTGRDLGSDLSESGSRSRGETAHDWLGFFGQRWCEKHGRIAYGHSGDAKACGALDGLLERMAPVETAKAWEDRERIVGEYLASAEPAAVRIGHVFAFFVPRFTGLALGTEQLAGRRDRSQEAQDHFLASMGMR